MADGMGKMRGGKRRQHPALPSQLKEADRYKQTCFSDLGCRCQPPVNSGMLLGALVVARGYDSRSLASALMA